MYAGCLFYTWIDSINSLVKAFDSGKCSSPHFLYRPCSREDLNPLADWAGERRLEILPGQYSSPGEWRSITTAVLSAGNLPSIYCCWHIRKERCYGVFLSGRLLRMCNFWEESRLQERFADLWIQIKSWALRPYFWHPSSSALPILINGKLYLWTSKNSGKVWL